MRRVKFIIPALILIGVVIFQSLFIVQEISQAIVLQFGDPKKIVTKAGVNFKLPFIQKVVYLENFWIEHQKADPFRAHRSQLSEFLFLSLLLLLLWCRHRSLEYSLKECKHLKNLLRGKMQADKKL